MSIAFTIFAQAAVANAPLHAPAEQAGERARLDVLSAALLSFGTLDGNRITAFKLRSKCETDFVTASGTITVNWAKVGNLVEHDEGAQVVTPINDGRGAHKLAVPKNKKTPAIGDVAAVVNMGLSGIVESCGATG